MSTKIRESHAVKSYGLMINIRKINQDQRKGVRSNGLKIKLGKVNQDHRKAVGLLAQDQPSKSQPRSQKGRNIIFSK